MPRYGEPKLAIALSSRSLMAAKTLRRCAGEADERKMVRVITGPQSAAVAACALAPLTARRDATAKETPNVTSVM